MANFTRHVCPTLLGHTHGNRWAERCRAFQASIVATLVFACGSNGETGNGTSNLGGTTSQVGVGGAVSTGGVAGGATSGIGGAQAGGAAQTGGSPGSGGARTGVGGNLTGGAQQTGGNAATGGTRPTPTTTGGSSSPGGSVSTGGIAATGGTRTAGGNSSNGGAVATGGSKTMGGSSAVTTGGTASAAGSSGTGPCDIYATASTPCVSAHSTVRALYGAYSGNLYQVRRASDKTTKDVPVSGPGGFVSISVQDTFCTGTTCTISIIYDQSTQHNDLIKSGVAHWLPNGGVEANATSGKVTVSGHTAYGIYVTSGSNVAYRNNATKGVAKNNDAESMYMVVDGKRFSSNCCFDYGNAETTGNDDGNGTMEAVYWGSDTTWGGKADGSGPWVAADLENGMFKCGQGGWQTTATCPNDKSIIANYATAVLKGPAANTFAIKGGNAQSGTLTTMYNAARPSPGYSPKKLQGAIILGTGGDGSNTGTGTFFEGAMTIGNPPDSVDDAIQANIVAAGYGK